MLQAPLPPIPRDELVGIMSGTVFVFVGLAACFVAAIRRRGGVRLFLWLGAWSAMYGARLLAESPAVVAALPHELHSGIPLFRMAIIYLLLPVAALAWLELSLGEVRLFLQTVIVLAVSIAAPGIALFISNSSEALLLYNNLLSAAALLVLLVIVAVPKLSRKFLILPNRAVMIVGTLVFASEALYFNLSRPLHYQTSRMTGSLGLAVLLFSFGYVAVELALSGEHRLRAMEQELAIAREIQASILPRSTLHQKNLSVAAAYRPMTAIAGDFYDFIPVDQRRTGFLVADVTGHGVPAALIASMIKVAMQSVAARANDPREVLRGLNRIFSAQQRAQLVSAAYLWIDTENRAALYSAAGHPPLLHWRAGNLERIESNGVLLGVFPESDYPVTEIRLQLGDRFLLYTDGAIEQENATGVAFGDHQLEQVIRDNQSRPPAELLEQLLSELARWQPTSSAQHDDITLIAIDVLPL